MLAPRQLQGEPLTAARKEYRKRSRRFRRPHLLTAAGAVIASIGIAVSAEADSFDIFDIFAFADFGRHVSNVSIFDTDNIFNLTATVNGRPVAIAVTSGPNLREDLNAKSISLTINGSPVTISTTGTSLAQITRPQNSDAVTTIQSTFHGAPLNLSIKGNPLAIARSSTLTATLNGVPVTIQLPAGVTFDQPGALTNALSKVFANGQLVFSGSILSGQPTPSGGDTGAAGDELSPSLQHPDPQQTVAVLGALGQLPIAQTLESEVLRGSLDMSFNQIDDHVGAMLANHDQPTAKAALAHDGGPLVAMTPVSISESASVIAWSSIGYLRGKDTNPLYRYSSAMYSGLAGLSMILDRSYMVGLAIGGVGLDFRTGFSGNPGSLNERAVTIAPYAAASFFDRQLVMALDLLYSNVRGSQVRNQTGNLAFGDFHSLRYGARLRGTGYYPVGDRVVLSPYLDATAGNESTRMFTETDGTVNPSMNAFLGDIRGGGRISYSIPTSRLTFSAELGYSYDLGNRFTKSRFSHLVRNSHGEVAAGVAYDVTNDISVGICGNAWFAYQDRSWYGSTATLSVKF